MRMRSRVLVRDRYAPCGVEIARWEERTHCHIVDQCPSVMELGRPSMMVRACKVLALGKVGIKSKTSIKDVPCTQTWPRKRLSLCPAKGSCWCDCETQIKIDKTCGEIVKDLVIEVTFRKASDRSSGCVSGVSQLIGTGSEQWQAAPTAFKRNTHTCFLYPHRSNMIFFPLILVFSTSAQVLGSTRTAEPSLPSFTAEVIFQSSVLLENIAARASSELLLTSFSSPTLFTLDPQTTNRTLSPVHTFPNATALTGIAEYHPGVFAVVASVINTATFRAALGSVVVWSIDLNTHTPTVHAICALPTVEGPNALTALPGHPDIILMADSIAGGVWQINTGTGKAQLAIQDALMQPDGPAPALGINGVHVRKLEPDTVYFSNSKAGTLARVAVCVEGGNLRATGAVEIVATVQSADAVQSPDDFAFDPKGRAWLTVHPGAVTLLSPPMNHTGQWTQLTAVGNALGSDTDLIQPTSAAFGRGNAVQEQTLYVVTGAGQIVAVDTKA